MRKCTGCQSELSLDQFNRRPNGANGYSSRCRACTNKYARGLYPKHRLKSLARSRKWRSENAEYDVTRKSEWYDKTRQHNLERMAAWRYKTHQAAISALGGICACCGEYRETMLDIDHINNDGAEHRTRARGGNFLVYREISENPDKTKYQVLCCNCNQSKRRNGGTCEHKTETQLAAFGWCI